MKLDIELNGKPHAVEIAPGSGRITASIDGSPLEPDVIEVADGMYSVIIAGRCFEARVEKFGEELRIAINGNEYAVRVRDPRKWQPNHSAAAASEHRQNVTAPMPGRVVRVLVKAGEAVAAGQGIVVVEAMKMQNEVRSPKAGKVERLLAKEGQALNAGDTIAVIA
jgi:biotin carboxyl carrier protein